MMSFISGKLKILSETLTTIENKLGLTKFIQYTLFIALIYAAFNFTSIVESVMKIQTEISKKEHEKRLMMRDELMTELSPLLIELRSASGASRVLYFEYHNSTENFVGIPFKFANLVLMNQTYGCTRFDNNVYRDINSGLISNLYDDLKKKDIIINDNTNHEEFYTKYQGINEFFSSKDSSVQQVFVNLPGVHCPVGLIVMEWTEEDEITSEKEWKDIQKVIATVIPRINALISRYTP